MRKIHLQYSCVYKKHFSAKIFTLKTDIVLYNIYAVVMNFPGSKGKNLLDA